MHFPYPKLEDAIESGKVVLKAITGGEVKRNDLVHCSYVVVGFGLGSTFPIDEHLPSGLRTSTAGAVPLPPAELEVQLRQFTSADPTLRGGINIPWLQIALAVMKFLEDYLKK